MGQYTDKMTQKCVKNESFCPYSDTMAQMSQMIHSGFSVLYGSLSVISQGGGYGRECGRGGNIKYLFTEELIKAHF